MQPTRRHLAAATLFLGGCGPAHSHVERSATYASPASDVWGHVMDLRKFYEWSPWSERDPSAKTAFSDPSSGVGAWYTWDGNDDVGSGKMSVAEVSEGTMVKYSIEFYSPWEGVSEATFELEPVADGTKVTWKFDQDNDAMSRVMLTFIDMDAMIGADYERGLARLEPQVAATTSAREAAEAAAKAKEAAAAEDAAEVAGG